VATTRYNTELMRQSNSEWNLDNLRYALGAGVTTATSLSIGGDINIAECALKFVHQMPSGGTVTIKIWKAQGAGEVTLTFGDDPHEIPYTFVALDSTTDWSGSSLSSGERLCRIELELP